MTVTMREILDHHYYFVDGVYYPSVTHIINDGAPTGEGLKIFLQDHNKAEGEQIRDEAAKFGSLMHDCYRRLLQGEELVLDDYSYKGKQHLMSFVNWAKEFKLKDPECEMTVYSNELKYAGTADLVCFKYGKRWLVDFKTSSHVYFNHEIQLVAYKKAYEEMTGNEIDHMAILRTGTKHKVGFEFVEVDRPFEHFKSVYDTFLNVNGGKFPKIPDEALQKFPERIKLEL